MQTRGRANPLAEFGRQDPCWCGSNRTYRMCHKRWTAPKSQPGAAVPPDSEDDLYLSPNLRLAKSAIPNLLPSGGAPIFLPMEELAPKPIAISELEGIIATAQATGTSVDPVELARHRADLLRELARLPPTDEALSDEKIERILSFGLMAYQSVGELAQATPKPTLLWNEELSPTQFLTKTLLLADHILVPDRLLADAVLTPTNRSIGDLARKELSDEELILSGRVIPVPNGVAMALGRTAVETLTRQDLQDSRLLKFTRNQLVVEGPTAREALIINARDDLKPSPRFWLYGRIDPGSVSDNGRFSMQMLQPHDPTYDYRPWIEQVKRDAVTHYIQRTVGRLTTSDLLGAEYVAASPFEARMLHERSAHETGPASASIWANVPALADLRSQDLARMLNNDDAVEDLRGKVRSAVTTSSTLHEQSAAISQLTAEIEQTSMSLEKKIRSERAYSAILPTLAGGAGLVVGGAGGVLGLAGAGLGLLGGLLPYLGNLQNNRREASYLFIMARRSKARR